MISFSGAKDVRPAEGEGWCRRRANVSFAPVGKGNCILGKMICKIAFFPPDLESHIYIQFNDEDVEVNRIN